MKDMEKEMLTQEARIFSMRRENRDMEGKVNEMKKRLDEKEKRYEVVIADLEQKRKEGNKWAKEEERLRLIIREMGRAAALIKTELSLTVQT